MKIKKLLCVAMALSTVFLSGCWSSSDESEIAISMCIGIDQTENGFLVTEQVVNPKTVASQKSAVGAPVVLYTAEGESLEVAIASLTTVSSRRLYHSQMRLVILSEEAAKSGIEEIFDYFLRNHDFRTDFYFAVAKGSSAKEILSVLTPMESIPGIDLYKKLELSNKELGTTKAAKIVEVVNSILSEGVSPVMAGIEIVGDSEDAGSTKALDSTDVGSRLEFTDSAAFNGDQFVSWISPEETLGYNFITDEVKNACQSVSCGEDAEITYNVMKAKAKMKATVEDGKPKVTVSIELDYSIQSIQGEFDPTKPEMKDALDESVSNQVKQICEASVTKAKELKTDIFGFGEAVHRTDPEYWKTVKEKWNEEFPDVPVDITVKAEISNTGGLSDYLFTKEES